MEYLHSRRNCYEENCEVFIEQWKDTNIIDNGKIETFIEMIQPKSKVLDIGAGLGKDVNYYCNKGFDCIGIDFCDSFIQKSKELYKTDMFSYYMRDAIDNMDKDLYKKYIQYTLTICENQNLVGVSNHTLDIFQKL